MSNIRKETYPNSPGRTRVPGQSDQVYPNSCISQLAPPPKRRPHVSEALRYLTNVAVSSSAHSLIHFTAASTPDRYRGNVFDNIIDYHVQGVLGRPPGERVTSSTRLTNLHTVEDIISRYSSSGNQHRVTISDRWSLIVISVRQDGRSE